MEPPKMPYTPIVRRARRRRWRRIHRSESRNVVYVSGTLAIDKDGKTSGLAMSRRRPASSLSRSNRVVERRGSTEGRRLQPHLPQDLKDYAAMNEVYREYFPADPPARYCIRADLVKPSS